MNAALAPVLLGALFAGALGSGHCFGMCGGIAAGLGTLVRHRGLSVLTFHAGRITAYALLGALAGWLLGQGGAVLPGWGRALRLAAALLVALLGLQLLGGWRLLAPLERLGAHAWRWVQPWAVRLAGREGAAGRFALGLCWGLLPCGLVYTALAMAAASGAGATGLLVMLAFGLGTLPAMLGMGLAAPALAGWLADRWTQRLAGAGLLLLAAWAAVLALGTGAHAH